MSTTLQSIIDEFSPEDQKIIEIMALADAYVWRAEDAARYGDGSYDYSGRISLKTAIEALVADRERLLEALKRIADPRNTHFAGDAQVVARTAIAKATGEQT